MIEKTSTLDKITPIGGTVIRANGVIFVIKRHRSMHWGKFVTYTSKRSVWFEYDALIVVTRLQTLKLMWTPKNGMDAHHKVVNKVKEGKISDMTDLYSEMSKHATRYGMPIVLVPTKLEYFYG